MAGAVPEAREAWVITGLPGAGKSTVARLLAGRFPRSAHVEGDRLAEMVVGGLVFPGQAPEAESERQSVLAMRHQCLLARSFARAGFVPILDYVTMTRGGVTFYRRALRRLDLHLVVLNPGKDAALERDRGRPADRQVAARWTHLEAIMLRELRGIGLWVDSRRQTPQETVTNILQEHARARL
jgi:predicted kinase